MYWDLDYSDLKILEKAVEITNTPCYKNGDLYLVDSLINIIDDLLSEMDRLEEKIEDMEKEDYK